METEVPNPFIYKGFSHFDLGSIPVDRTTKKEISFEVSFFVLCFSRQELRVGAVLREQNALPYEAFISTFSWAKDDVDNVGSGACR